MTLGIYHNLVYFGEESIDKNQHNAVTSIFWEIIRDCEHTVRRNPFKYQNMDHN